MFFLIKSTSFIVLDNTDRFSELLGGRTQMDFDCEQYPSDDDEPYKRQALAVGGNIELISGRKI
jgi:hypothetical protein